MAHEVGPEPFGDPGALPGTTQLESGFPYETVLEVITMGHAVGWMAGGYGGDGGTRLDPGQKVYFGASESRKFGQAATFPCPASPNGSYTCGPGLLETPLPCCLEN